MTWLWWLILGLLGGWLIELAIDFRFWRRRAALAQKQIAEQDALLERKAQAVAARETEAAAREREIGVREETLAARDADLLAQARRIDERDQEISRVEQRLDARRVELEKHAAELIERDRDMAARTQALKAQESDHAQREARIAAVEAEQTRRQSSLASRETALRNWEQRILSKEQDIGLREAAAARLEHEHAQSKRQFEAMRSVFGSRYRTASGDDDLQAIEGIGPKAVALLGGAGITGFERLSETPLGELSRLVEQGGADLALADPMSWAEQAALIVAEDYVGFENLKSSLRGEAPLLAGHAPATPATPDAHRRADADDDGTDADAEAGGDGAETGIDAAVAVYVAADIAADVASDDREAERAGVGISAAAGNEPDARRPTEPPSDETVSAQRRLEWADALVDDAAASADAHHPADDAAGGAPRGSTGRAS
ncbi:MAG: hypothetical protein AB7P21_27840 [Lautropia sp.]